MNILITGGTGLLGRALCQALVQEGHTLTVLSRRPKQVGRLCGAAVRALASLDEWQADTHFEAIINLAGAPIIDWPWTATRKAQLWQSRVALTDALLSAIARAEQKPALLISGSAVGYYGDQGDTECSDLTEAHTPRPQDFGAKLCAAWEAAAQGASSLETRVCLLRTGIVLSPQGGFLARLRLPFTLGLGARLGDGRQWMSWIHVDDFVGAVRHLLAHPGASGAFNLCAPEPARNAEFTQALAQAYGRRACLYAPASLLRLSLGERALLLLGGQCARPDHLLKLGYVFRHPTLEAALQHAS